MTRFGNLLFTALLLAAALLIGFLSTRLGVQHDFSYAARSSLNAQSVALLQRLDAPVEIVSYARRDGELRGVIADFVARYQRLKPDIALDFVDPDADPGAMREQGIRVDGELDIRYRGRSERLKVLSEQELSNALLRLSRERERLVAFLAGAGERKADGAANADLGNFGALLREQGIRTLALTLATAPSIPDNLELLVIANPQVRLDAAVLAELADYVERGGNLLLLTEPGEEVGLAPLVEALGVRVLAGTAVDGASAKLGIHDPSFVAISDYPAHPITQGFDLVTLFPQPAALAALSGARWALQPLLRSSATSWTETGPIPTSGASSTIRFDAAAGEIPGPLDLGFALSRLSPRPDRQEQRAVVLGDGDFLSNAYLGNGGNREFGQRVFNWLLADDAQIRIADVGAPDRQLALSQGLLGLLGAGFLFVLPLALLASGALLWWRRRRH